MIDVRKQGRFYTLNGQVVRPESFYAVSAFKFPNHIWAWIMGGAHGEPGGVHLDRARRFIERDVVGLGCRRMRSPVELMFWGPPYFDLPARKNVANSRDLVDLHVPGGSGYRMTEGLKKLIRMYVVLAREFDIVIEVPWLWTIKGPGIPKWLEGEPDASDPRGDSADIAGWNEHFLGNEAEGICMYLRKLRTEGDGEGEDRVDPGGTNVLSDGMNEFTAHSVVWDQQQLKNVARRFHERNGQGELLLISQSGAANRYDPPLASRYGSQGFDGVCQHPPRDDFMLLLEDAERYGARIERVETVAGRKLAAISWINAAAVSRGAFPDELIDWNESMMGWTQAEAEHWVPLIGKWASLATTDLSAWSRLHLNAVAAGIYTTFHTKRGMDASWPESQQTATEDAIRAITGGGTHPPPPEPEPKELTCGRVIHQAYLEVLDRPADPEGLAHYDELMLGGMTEAEIREKLIRSDEFRGKNTR